jgi:DNA-binding MarR family transcriptional regulator
MNKSLNIIAQIAEELKTYELENSEIDYNQFVNYLYYKNLDKDRSEEHSYGELHLYIHTVSRSVKNKFTSLLKKWPISTYDEYNFLVHIQHLGSTRKMELVQMHLMSAASGFEVIQKLLKRKLVKEFPDPDDKRSTRIKLTTEGINLVNELNPIVSDFLKDKYYQIENIEEIILGLKSLIK